MATNGDVFHRKDVLPDSLVLKRGLGAAHRFYEELLRLAGDFPCEWKFYGARYGWMLKFARKGKALLYLIPREGAFLISCAVRDKERDVLLAGKLPAKVKEELLAAKRYPEGYPLRLLVEGEAGMNTARLVVGMLRTMRT